MALIEEAQGLEKEAKIEILPSEVFEKTGKEQQTLNLHSKLKMAKEADASLSSNLKISQGVATAKRHLDHLFQREISQDGSGGETDSEKEIHNNSIAFDLKGIDEVTEWERTITDIAQAHQLEIRHMCIFSIYFYIGASALFTLFSFSISTLDSGRTSTFVGLIYSAWKYS